MYTISNPYLHLPHTHPHTHIYTPCVDSGDEREPRAVLGEWFNEIASGQLCGSDAAGVEAGAGVGHGHRHYHIALRRYIILPVSADQ